MLPIKPKVTLQELFIVYDGVCFLQNKPTRGDSIFLNIVKTLFSSQRGCSSEIASSYFFRPSQV